MDENMHITLRCLFCSQPLKAEEGAEFQSSDMIECSECGESNDYDSVFEVAKESALEEVKSQLQDDVKKKFGKHFKKK